MDNERTEVRCVRGAGCGCFRFCSDELVELVDANSVWCATDQFLASPGRLDPVQDSIRRVPWPAGPPDALATANGGALGTDDPGRTREVPPGYAQGLRPVQGAGG